MHATRVKDIATKHDTYRFQSQWMLWEMKYSSDGAI